MDEIKVIQTTRAPAVVGPYSQAICAGGFIFMAGQLPLDPTTGQMVNDSVEAATERVLENLKAVLEAAGSSLDRIVKTTVFLRDLADFTAMNEVYGRYFSVRPPARSTVQAVLPRGARVEIEAVAML